MDCWRIVSNNVPLSGFAWALYWIGDDEASFNFGQHKGRLLREIADEHPDYLGWILGQDFSPKVLGIITNALKGEFPDWY